MWYQNTHNVKILSKNKEFFKSYSQKTFFQISNLQHGWLIFMSMFLKAGWISENFPSWTYCSLPKTAVSLTWSPIFCYMEDSSIFISWLTCCYWFLPCLLFYCHGIFIFFVTHNSRYRNMWLPQPCSACHFELQNVSSVDSHTATWTSI